MIIIRTKKSNGKGRNKNEGCTAAARSAAVRDSPDRMRKADGGERVSSDRQRNGDSG